MDTVERIVAQRRSMASILIALLLALSLIPATDLMKWQLAWADETGKYAIAIDPDIEFGRITSSANCYAESKFEFTVQPSFGYKLVSGSLGYIANGSFTPCENQMAGRVSTIMPASDIMLTAEFELDSATPALIEGAYQVGTAEELCWVARQCNNGYGKGLNVELTADIDLSGVDWTPIGTVSGYSTEVGGGYNSYSYAGVFDGHGYTVTFADSRGLFGYVGYIYPGEQDPNGITCSGSVVNVVTAGVCVGNGAVADTLRLGSSIRGCTNTATVNNADAYAGGNVGSADGVVSECANTGQVSSSKSGASVGGIAGNAINAYDCTNSGIINGSNGATGGIAGSYGSLGIGGGWMTGCTNSGPVSGTGHVGGLVGNLGDGQLAGCMNSGTVQGRNAGGIVGFGSRAVVEGSVNTGWIIAVAGASQCNLGGIVGHLFFGSTTDNADTHISGCVNVGSVDATGAISACCGGILGLCDGANAVTGNYNGAAIIGAWREVANDTQPYEGSAGGIVGWLRSGGGGYGTLANNAVLGGNYNTGLASLPETEVGAGGSGHSGPVLGEFSDTSPNAAILSGSWYAPDSVPAGVQVLWGTAVMPGNYSQVDNALSAILRAAGLDDATVLADGGYPLPAALTVVERQPVSVSFELSPVDAELTVTDIAAGSIVVPVEPDGAGYLLLPNKAYSWSVSAAGFHTRSSTFTVSGPQTIAIQLVPDSQPDYQPGWDKWRPTFGVYILNRDSRTGTLLASYNYDVNKATYVDTSGEPAPFITDFSDTEQGGLFYCGIDKYPAIRMGVVVRGVTYPELIGWYNENNGSYPDITLENYSSFTVTAATNSAATEDPFTSNDPTRPGKWQIPGFFDSLSGEMRYYYPSWLLGANSGSAILSKALGDGEPVQSVLAVQSYNMRVMQMPVDVVGSDYQISNPFELAAAEQYLLSVADTERALRNFESLTSGTLASFAANPDAPGSRPLGGDGSYYIGSVWIAPTYYDVSTTVVGGSQSGTGATVSLAAPMDALPKAFEGEVVNFTISGVEAGKHIESVKVGSEVLTVDEDGSYSFFMPADATTIMVLLADDAGPGLGAASGDVDCDGELTIADAVLILRAAIGLETLTPEALSAADVDGDGILTMADALITARRAVGVGV